MMIMMMYMIVPCAITPCENGGLCQLLATNVYGCACPAEFTGTRCETSLICKMIVVRIDMIVIDDYLFI